MGAEAITTRQLDELAAELVDDLSLDLINAAKPLSP
jgi:hypothetical protein